MTNEQFLIELAIQAVAVITQGDIPGLLLRVARSDANDSGWMYNLWCDSQGQCGLCEEECSDEAQLACIRRFLDREYPFASEPHGV